MSSVDLSALRSSANPTTVDRTPRGPRVLGVCAVLLVVTVAATFVWPWLWPVRTVPTSPVEVAAVAGVSSGTTAVEAAGWVEPDPFPVEVRPLVAGRIDTIEVLEGSAVRAGETVLARLSSAPVRARLEAAEAAVQERMAEVAVVNARRDAAAALLAQRATVRSALAAAEAAVAAVDARLATVEGAVLRSRADAEAAIAARTAQKRLVDNGGANAIALARAEAAVAAAEAVARAAVVEAESAHRESAAVRAAREVAVEVATTPVELATAVDVATKEAARAEATLASARVEFAIAQREAEHLVVHAPTDGVVLEVHGMPGSAAAPDGASILSLYDPARVRVRVDVPLGSAKDVREGQDVELRSEVLGTEVVKGRVARVVRKADLLKNTLQAKVIVLDPPPLLRPETLCRARFLVQDTPAVEGTGAPVAFRVPRSALHEGAVFVVDPSTRRARRVAVEVVQEDGDRVVVRGELSATHRVVLVPVSAGESVQEESR